MQITQDMRDAERGIRQNAAGNWEAVLTHKVLIRQGKKTGISRTFTSRDEAADWKITRRRELDAELLDGAKLAAPNARPVTEALAHAGRPRRLVKIISLWMAAPRGETGASKSGLIEAGSLRNMPSLDIDVEEVTFKWAMDWIAKHKTGPNRVKPDTIKGHVQRLRTILDWYHATYWLKLELEPPLNPLHKLPNNYAAYDFTDPNRLANTQRDRRLKAGEEAAIEEVILGLRKRACNRKVPDPLDTLMFFRLLVGTALRLREAYRLRVKDIDVKAHTVAVRQSKLTVEGDDQRGKRTTVMTASLAKQLGKYLEARGIATQPEAIVFPYWEGDLLDWELNEVRLNRTTMAMSQKFKAIFKDAGAPDLRVHDLRHEATSRFCEMRYPDGTRLYTKWEVMRFTGHTEEATFERYANLFAADDTPAAKLAMRRKHEDAANNGLQVVAA